MSSARRFALLGGLVVLLLGLAAAPAAATITPQNRCTGNGQFTPGPNVDAARATSIEIPLKASVAYSGSVILPTPPPEEGRPIAGSVEVKLPFSSVTVGSWEDPDATGVNKNGTYTYDLPSVLAGFDVTISGKHLENGAQWCSGTVTVRLEGSNPLGIAAIAFTVISVVGVSLSVLAQSGGGGGTTTHEITPGEPYEV